jgi:YgiT-type zinc finger domain-containing protein
MKCMHCKGKMEYKTAPFHIDRKGYHLMLDAVPAWVCTQCGEIYIDESEVDTIQDALKTLDERVERLAVAV